MEFTAETLVSGKDFSNIKKIKITYNKDLGNLGLKSLEITHKTN